MATRKIVEIKQIEAGMKITVCKNGPYRVTGGIPISTQTMLCDEDGLAWGWQAGEELPVEEEVYLCRCGRSQNKPFCDRTHKTIHFDGSETAGHTPYLDQVDVTEGAAIDLTDAPALCASARFCDRAGGAWDNTRQSDDPDARQIAIEEAWNCPAGRLAVWAKDGKAIEPDLPPSIGLVEDPYVGVHGPLWVRGYVPIESAEGVPYEVRNRVTLCRCGHSQNKPFCDGKHVDFKDE